MKIEIMTPLEKQQILQPSKSTLAFALPAPDLFYSPQNRLRHLYFISYSTLGYYKHNPKEAASSASRKQKKTPTHQTQALLQRETQSNHGVCS